MKGNQPRPRFELVFISYDDNHYTKGTSKLFYTYTKLMYTSLVYTGY